MVRHAGVYPYTTQYMHTPKYVYDVDAAGGLGHGAAARRWWRCGHR